jgi:hypothetical protein
MFHCRCKLHPALLSRGEPTPNNTQQDGLSTSDDDTSDDSAAVQPQSKAAILCNESDCMAVVKTCCQNPVATTLHSDH